MWLLALDTASSSGSLALLRDERVVLRRALDGRQYGSVLFGAVAAALAEVELSLDRLDALAVANGPGSFTGVRIGLTAMKGFAEVLDKPMAAVSTLRAVAAMPAESRDPVLTALDASRDEVYFGFYPDGAFATPDGDATEGLESAAAFTLRLERHAGAALTPQPALLARWSRLQRVEPGLAAGVARLGLRRIQSGLAANPLQVDARYLRRSDAEIFTAPQWP